MRYYTINEVAMMTGFTTRTLRNYINAGMLEGEKIGGVWKFSADDFTHFLSDPNVISGIKSKNNAQALEFLANNKKKENQICTILDFYVDDVESAEISDFFCDQMNRLPDASGDTDSNAHFSLQRIGQNTRVILTGPEDVISKIMCSYYSGIEKSSIG